MNEIIKKQLEKCSFANLNNYNETTHTFFIPKYSKPKYEVGKCYLIQLSQEIINNTNHVIAVNWNQGRTPQAEYYKAYVNKSAGKMINVDAIEFDITQQIDNNKMFSGWLSIDDISQVQQL